MRKQKISAKTNVPLGAADELAKISAGTVSIDTLLNPAGAD
jgi:hypothetical protein